MINQLRNEENYFIDIIITGKDILEELLINEGWNYTNIFPKGRKLRYLPRYISAFINTLITIYRLLKYLRKKDYDLFVTDDLLTIPGLIKNIPTLSFQDDDLKVVPESAIILSTAKHIIAPISTDLGIFNTKKVGFYGFKELAYLHPNCFTPKRKKIHSIINNENRYFFIRLVSLQSTHDLGKKGITDEILKRIIDLLKPFGEIVISAERKLPIEFEKYRLLTNYNDIAHLLYFADLFIGDSQTMASESAILGTPSIRFNDFSGKISVLNELEKKYKLSYSFNTKEENSFYNKIHELLSMPNRELIFQERRKKMIMDKIDVTSFFIWMIKNYPNSINKIISEPKYQLRFK